MFVQYYWWYLKHTSSEAEDALDDISYMSCDFNVLYRLKTNLLGLNARYLT